MKKIPVLFILLAMMFLIACSSEDDYTPDAQTEETKVTQAAEDNKITQAAEEAKVTQTEKKDEKKDDASDIDDPDEDYYEDDDYDDGEDYGDDYWEDDDSNDDYGEIDDDSEGDSYNNDYYDEDEPDAKYGTYSYRPEGMLPYFDEITVDNLYSDSKSYNNMLKDLQKGFEAYKKENTYSDFGELDLESIGSTPRGNWGIYYKGDEETDYSYNKDDPLENVESWLVFFKCGTWAIYDHDFKNILDAGVLVCPETADWRFFTINRKGEFTYLMEFDTGTMSGDFGSYYRVYELWDYENGNGGSGNNGRANDDPDNSDPASDTTSKEATLLDNNGNVAMKVNVPEGFSIEEDNTSDETLYFTTDTGEILSVEYTTGLWHEELLTEGKKITIGDMIAYTDSDGNELEEGTVSHTVIVLGYDSDHDNRLVYSVVEYGDTPLTYRLMFIELGDDKWAAVYSGTFQQDGIDDLYAINEQMNIYFKMFN